MIVGLVGMQVITWCGCSSESVRRPSGQRGAGIAAGSFPVPLAEPGMRRSTHRDLHGFARQVGFAQGVGIVPRI
jgi:hypothetical protein